MTRPRQTQPLAPFMLTEEIRMLTQLKLGLFTVGLWSLLGTASYALPGQTVREVEAWIQANPTLRPAPGERLTVNKVDTPAQRFTFQASMFAPGNIATAFSPGIIRTERLLLVDLINGVSVPRLEESLRAIYSSDVYTDYRRAVSLYVYPNVDTQPTANQHLILKGELLEGERFGYWVELTVDPQGVVQTGRITILLKQDLGALRDQIAQTGSP